MPGKKTVTEVNLYEKHWKEGLAEFNKLKRAVARIRAEAIDNDSEAVSTLKRYLKEYLTSKDEVLSATEIVRKYHEDLTKIDNSPDWWVFGYVATCLDYEIFFAEVEEIGYKRTVRGERPRPNELDGIAVAMQASITW